MSEAEPPWDYLAMARAAVTRANDILAVARARLEPLGVPVFPGNTRSGMPFDDEVFDLVLNRHGGFRTVEMDRILKPGGVFLTRQVGNEPASVGIREDRRRVIRNISRFISQAIIG